MPFQYHCSTILDFFFNQWRKTAEKVDYIDAFEVDKWKSMTSANKAQHTLSNCIGCYTLFSDRQMTFPLKPRFIPENTVQLTGETERIAAQRLIRCKQ